MPIDEFNQDENPQENHNIPEVPAPSPNYEEEEAPQQAAEWGKENISEATPDVDQVDQKENEVDKIQEYTKEPLTNSEERTWAMLAHFSVLLNLVSGFVGIIAAIIIYFIYKDRSRFVAYHAMQSFIFQSITWIGAGIVSAILITIGSTLSFLIIPLLCLVPGFLVLLLIPGSLIYGIIGGVQVNNGEDFRYWQVGDWVRDILEPKSNP
ncbi:MAG: DUF4870 domain-containing protein [Chloroflexota bacterium]|nr:DUF4870 domain-containing protein [Chloroflexota bacterium]